jgi:hypothetical protein
MIRLFAMVEVNRDFIIAITLLNSEKSVLTFGQSAPMRCVVAHLAVIARNGAIHCGLGKGPWIATSLRDSQ